MPKYLTLKENLVRGQFYIDLIIAVAVLSILGLTLFRLSALSYEIISFNRARIAATNLAVLRKIAGTILSKLDPGKPLIYKMMALGSADAFRDRFINFKF